MMKTAHPSQRPAPLSQRTSHLTRRHVLQAALATGACSLWPRLGTTETAPAPMPTLTAQAGTAQLAPAGYAKTAILGFEGRVPGPTLRARQGSWLERRVVNRLDMPTSVHWHGVRLENGMDGVSGLTQAPIAPGDSFAYRFPLQDAGTFWYHAHHRSYMQVAQGLYGALIVDEPERPDIDADEALLIDDWRLDPETVQIRADFDNRHDHSHAGRLGNLVTVNGAFTHEGARSQNSRLRLRLINAANARVFRLGVQGMSAWVMALDGMPVAQPWPLNQPIDLAPGQRVDLFADITAAPGTQAHLLDIAQNGEGWALASWTAQTGGTRLPRPAPQPLPENPQMAVPAIDTARQVQLDMTGGAMGGLREARYQGQMLDARSLAMQGKFWAFNGRAGDMDSPLLSAFQGETLRLRLHNNTAFAHAMHLHGMHFREVLPNGSTGPMRDTVLMQRGQTRDIAFVAHSPGKWLLHCHMLGHAAAGMITWIEVLA